MEMSFCSGFRKLVSRVSVFRQRHSARSASRPSEHSVGCSRRSQVSKVTFKREQNRFKSKKTVENKTV